MKKTDAFLEVLGAIYDAALDPDYWSGAMTEIARLTDADCVHLFGLAVHTNRAGFAFSNDQISEDHLRDYHSYYHKN